LLAASLELTEVKNAPLLPVGCLVDEAKGDDVSPGGALLLNE